MRNIFRRNRREEVKVYRAKVMCLDNGNVEEVIIRSDEFTGYAMCDNIEIIELVEITK